ncbi:MAG: glycine cleavage system protein GcvH [Bacteroidota bacterium]
MSTPAHLLYTKDHEWIRIHDDHTATIGITDFAQSELGDIVFVELNEVGDECVKDDTFGTVEAVKTVSDLYAPMDGEIIEVNEKLDDEPELVNDDPYGEGWMIKIKITDPSQKEDLLSAESYQDLI